MIRNYLIFCTLLTAMWSHAQQSGMGAPGGGNIPNVDKESLIIEVPTKWYPFHRTTDTKVDTFIFPTGQNPQDWKEALQSEQFLTTLGVTSARQVYDFRTLGSNCSEHSSAITKEADENGYSMAQWTDNCLQENGTMVVTLAKAIVGNEQLYIINKIWKYEPRDSDMSEWETYLDGVYVCDPTRGRSNACQRSGGGAGGSRQER